MKKFLLRSVGLIHLIVGYSNYCFSQPSAPTVVSTNPLQNKHAATLTQNVLTTFSQTMNGPTTAVSSSIRVIGNKRGSFSYPGGTFLGGGTANISYNPPRDFFPGEQLSLIQNTNCERVTSLVNLVRGQQTIFWGAAGGGTADFTSGATSTLTNGNITQTENADLNGDGNLDFIFMFSNGSGNTLAYKLNNGSGSFGTTVNLFIGGPFSNINCFTVGDYNNDGDIDIALCYVDDDGSTQSPFVRILSNSGSATFSSANYSVPFGYSQMISADMDSDGDLDLVCAYNFGGAIYSIANNGAANFSATPFTIVTGITSVNNIVAGDFNGDRLMDVAATRASAFIWILLQSTSGTYTTGTYSTATNTSLTKISIVDVDSDGDLDVAVLNPNDLKVLFMLNSGLGVLSTPTSITSGSNVVFDYSFADFDGDGDFDLSTNETNFVRIYKNTSGAFALYSSLNLGTNALTIFTTGDMDNDGDIDIVGRRNNGVSTLLYFLPNSNNIKTSTNAVSNVCAGSQITVSWTVSATLAATNDFFIQLSDSLGSFISPTTLGTVINSGVGGSALVTIPGSTYPSSNYRIRVVSNIAGVTANNSNAFAVNTPPPIAVDYFCDINTTYLSANSSGTINPTFTWSPSTYLNQTTGADVEATPAVPTSYTVTVTDLNGCTNDSITPLLPVTCYCTTPTFGACNQVHISNVVLNTTLTNATACASANGTAYNVFPQSGSTTTTLVKGNTYTFQVRNGGTASGVKVAWFDWDGSGTFDPGEFVNISTSVVPGTTNSVNVTVPLTATNGTIGIRIRAYGVGITMGSGNACTAYGSQGETEDYFVTLEAPQVVTFNPTVNNDCVPLASNVSNTFNTSMAAANSSTFVVNALKTGVKSGVYSGGGTSTLTFNPTTNFKRGEKVMVTLTGSMLSSTGAPIIHDYHYEFFATAGTGPATFDSEPQSHTFSDNVGDIGVGDFNNDGNLDYIAVVSGTNSTTLNQFLGTGSGTFAAATTITTPFSNPIRIEVGDMENDGDLDFVITYSTSTNISVFKNSGAASYVIQSLSTGTVGVQDFALADFDGDGDLDIAADNRGSAQLYFIRNVGTGLQVVDITSTGNANYFMVAGDFDNDFAYDVAVYNLSDATIDVYSLKIGSGFSLQNSFSTGGVATGLKCFDYNNDGNLDIVYGDLGNDLLRYRQGNGDYTFGLGFQVSGIDAPINSEVADYDGDCDLDVMFASGLQVNDMVLFKNNGAGSFVAQTALNGSRRPQTIRSGDFDGDGDIDIIGINNTSDQPTFFRNTNYSITASVPAGPYCNSPTITVSWTATDSLASNLMTYELSDASGSFASPTILGTATQSGINGSLSVTIPAVITGTGYRIRVRPTLTPITIIDNGVNLGLGTTPVVSVTTSCATTTSTQLVAASAATYLWAPAAGLSGTTTQTVTASPSSPTNYTLTLSNSGCSASRVISVGDKCYCYPSFSGSCADVHVRLFNLNTLSYSGACSGNLRSFNVSPSSSFTTTVNVQSSYTVSVANANAASARGGVWIDYNQDGDFADANEFIFAASSYTNALQSTTFTVPSGALTGQTRVRVLSRDAIVTSGDFCSSNTTGEVRDFIITIAPCIPPTSFFATGGGAYCSGGTGVSINLSGSQSGVTYALVLNGTPTGATLNGTGAAIAFNGVTTAGAYSISATNAGGCTAVMSGAVNVTINPLPTAFNVTGSGAYCAGGAGVPISLSNSSNGVTYRLIRNGVTIVSALSGTNAALVFPNQTVAGTYTVTGTNNTTLCTNTMNGSVVVTINPLPTAYLIFGGGSYCAGGAGSQVALSDSDLGITYELYLGGAPTGITQAGTGSLIQFSNVLAAGTYTINAVNNTTLCSNLMSGSATISVQALPTSFTVSGGGAICASGTGATINLSGTDNNAIYELYLNAGSTGNVISGTGSPISYTGITTAGTYTVFATSTSGISCTNTMSGSATVTVTPAPSVTSVSPTVNSNNSNFNLNTNTTFSTAMSGSAASNASVAVYGSESGLLSGAYSLQTGNTVVRFNPTLDFKAGEEVSVIHNINTSSSTGCAVEQPYTYNFKAKGAVAPATFFQQNFSTGDNFTDLKFADLNEDGFLDYIGTYGNLKVALNNGTGFHNGFTNYAFGSTIDAELGDYDKDGDVDVIVLNRFNSQITRMRNNGTGTLTAQVVITVPNTTNDMIVADFNGDGFLDLAVSAASTVPSYFIYIYYGDGVSFNLGYTLNASFPHTKLTVVDINGDYLNDIAAINSSDSFVDYFFNSASNPGQFPLSGGNSSGIASSGLSEIISNDVNNDGLEDIIVISPSAGPNGYSVMLNAGGSFGNAPVALTNTPRSIVLDDFDGDSDLDLVFGYDISGALQLYKNNSAGAFTYDSDLNGFGYGLASGDLNNDGDIDIATGPSNDSFEFLFYLDNVVVYTTTVTSVNTTPVCAGNNVTVNWSVNQSFPSGNIFTFELSDGNGNFTTPVILGTLASQIGGSLVVTIPGGTTSGNAYQIRVTSNSAASNAMESSSFTINASPIASNVSGGGNICPGGAGLTISLANSDPGVEYRMYLLGSQVGFSFGTGGILNFTNITTPGVYTIEGDYDGSGCTTLMNGSATITLLPTPTVASSNPLQNDLDINRNSNVTTSYNTTMSNLNLNTRNHYWGSMTGYLNNVSGSGINLTGSNQNVEFNPSQNFKPGEKVSVVNTTSNVSAAGCAVTVPRANEFYAKANAGPFTFVEQTDISLNTPTQTALGDVDNDGDIDAVTIHFGNAGMMIDYNDGTGAFPTNDPLIVGSNAIKVKLADMDNDGDLDAVIMRSSGGNAINISENFGGGNFNTSLINVATGGGTKFDFDIADINGDGRLDISLINNFPQLVLLINNGSFSFNNSSISLGSNTPSRIANGDFNNDGRIDAAISSALQNNVLICLTNSSGQYSSVNTVTALVNSNPFGMMAFDANNDNALDIITINTGTANQKYSVFLNNGTGTTYTRTDVIALSLGEVTPGDFDGDGDIDFVATNSSFNLVKYTNNGNGVFTQSSFTTGNAYSNLNSADLDGDFDMDLFANASSSDLSTPIFNAGAPVISINNLSGNVCLPAGFNFGYSSSGGTFVAGNVFNVELSNASGSFASPTNIGSLTSTAVSGNIFVNIPGGTPNGVGYRIRVVSTSPIVTSNATAAFTISETPTLVSFVPTQNDIDVARNTVVSTNYSVSMNGTSLNTKNFIHGSVSGLLNNVSGATFTSTNGNQTLNFNSANNYYPGELVTVTNTSDNISTGGCAPSKSVQQFTTKAAPAPFVFTEKDLTVALNMSNAIVGDVNNDGIMDLVSLRNGNNIIVQYNVASASSISVGVPAGCKGLALADINHDGFLEILTLNSNTNTFVRILQNDGTGNFPTFVNVSIATGNVGQDFTVSDFDGNGLPDIAVTSISNNRIDVALNQGSYSFGSLLTSFMPITFTRLKNGDFDNDGDIDILATALFEGTVSVLVNDGNGLFSNDYNDVQYTSGQFVVYNEAYVADYNNDNLLDVFVITNSASAPFIDRTVYLNNGFLSFTKTPIAGTDNESSNACAGDFDGDGDIDVLAAGASPFNGYTKYTNNGAGGFTRTIEGSNNLIEAFAINAFDYDDDKDMDAYAFSSTNATTSILINQSLTYAGVITNYCAGANLSVNYTLTGKSLLTGNVMTVQLSNSVGSFATPTNIGTLASTANTGTINATIPAGTPAGTGYSIRIITTDGTISINNVFNITINATVTPTVTIAASPSGAQCNGTSITFTPTPTNGGAPSYEWFVNGISVSTSNTFTTTSLNNNDVVSCEMTSSLTCISTNPVLSNNITQLINSPLPVSISISTVTVGAPCAGTSITYTSSVTNGGGSPVYSWRVNGSPVGVATPSFTTSTLNNGDIVTCRVTSSLTCVSGNPAISNSIVQGITAPLPVSATITQNPAGQVCAGTSVTWTANVVNGGSPSYQWFINGSFCCSGSTFNTSAPVAGNTVQCVVTSSLGCVSGSPATSNTIVMDVLSPSPASVSISASPSGAQCAGTNIIYSASPSNGGGSPTYQWTVNGINVGTGATFASSSLNNGDVIECEMTSSLSCVSNNPAMSNSITQVISPILPVSVNINALPAGPQCAGTSITFTATGSNVGSGSFQWFVNGSPVGLGSTFVSNSLIDGDNISCVATSNLTCVSGSPATSNTISQAVITGLPVSVSIGVSPSNIICAGSNVTFTATPTNGGALPDYQWKINGSNVGTNSPTFATTGLTNGQIVTCELTSSDACATGNPALSNAINMTVNPQIVPTITISANPGNNICFGASVTFNAIITNGGAAPVYQWLINGIPTGTNSASLSTSALNNSDIVTCQLTSNANCLAVATANSNSILMNVNNPSAPTLTFVNQCGFTEITASGFVGTLNWSDAGTGNPRQVPAGSYSVTQTTGGCTSINSNIVVANPFPEITSLSTTITDENCGLSNGEIVITPNGGTSSFQFEINSGGLGLNNTFSNLSAGTYLINVVDANGCSFTNNETVNSISGPTALTITVNDASCGSNNGSIDVTGVSGGTPGYTYSLDGISYVGTTLFNGLSSGAYTIFVKDANNCVFSQGFNINNLGGVTSIASSITDATCGNSNGSINVTSVTGGTAAYSYSLDGIVYVGTTLFSGLSSGSYTIFVKDANSCIFSQGFTINNLSGVSSIVTLINNATCGNSNGSIVVDTLSGGTPGYLYNIDGGLFNTPNSFFGLAGGTYIVGVQDANGCVYTEPVNVISLAGPSSLSFNITDETCNQANGAVDVNFILGGGALFSVTFAGVPSLNTSYPNLAAGNYFVTVLDVNGCSISSTASVNSTPAITSISTSVNNATCGSNNGSINVTSVTGGTAAYTYSLDGISYVGTTLFSGLASGAYTIFVQDANNCVFSQGFNINNTGGVTSITSSITDATCGSNNGSINVTSVTGGTAGYTYSLDGISYVGTTLFSALSSGAYTIFVQDANNCVFSQGFNINNTGGVTSITSSITDATCGNSNGSINVTSVTGGTAGYTYSLDGTSYVGTTLFSSLASGAYTIFVQDANNCVFSQGFNINNSGGVTSITSNIVDATCGSNNGSINVTSVTGGTAAYTYSLDGISYVGTTLFSGLASGAYTIFVQDANNCVFSQGFNINNTGGVTSITSSITDATCGSNNGSINVTSVTGGTAAYTYSLDGTSYVGTTLFSGLASGAYTIFVQDANNCVFSQGFNINNSGGVTSITSNIVDATCGSNNGSINVTSVTGGTAAYTYSLDGISYMGTTLFSGLASGAYTIFVQDANNCVFSQGFNINNSGGVTSITSNIVDATCGSNNGSINVTSVTGGTAAYTYSLDGISYVGTTLFSGLASGAYIIFVQDANNCVFSQGFNINSLGGPTAVTTTVTNENCGFGNGSFVITGVTGGVGPYNYDFNSLGFSLNASYFGLIAGTYSLIVQDNNLCSFTTSITIGNNAGPTGFTASVTNANCGSSDGDITIATVNGGAAPYTYSNGGGNFFPPNQFTGLNAGIYNIYVQDNNGCQYNELVTVGNLGSLSVTLSTTDETCGFINGTIQASISGGTAPYDILWSNGDTAQDIFGLSAGLYSVSVTDAFGCIGIANATILNNVITLSANITDANCGNNNGEIDLTVSGGDGAYTYTWSNGELNEDINSLIAGNYDVTVNDYNGCTASASYTVGDTPGITNYNTTTIDATCGSNNGSIEVTSVTGGTAPYEYYIDGVSQSNNNIFANLTSGSYLIKVEDVLHCEFETTILVNTTASITSVNTSVQDETCGELNGSFTFISVTGGVAPYSYSFNGSPFSLQTFYTGLNNGIYNYEVIDDLGCNFIGNVTVASIGAVTSITTNVIDETCGGANGSIEVTAAFGGTPPYEYALNSGPYSSTPIFTGLSAANDTIYVKDNIGCIFQQIVTVGGTAAALANAGLDITVCENTNVTLTASGGVSYTWDNGLGNTSVVNFTAIATTDYIVEVQDANGCIDADTVTVNVNLLPATPIITASGPTTFCFGNSVDLTSSYVGGNTWSTTATTDAININAVGVYNIDVTHTDANGCSATSAPISVTVNALPATPTITANGPTTFCFGNSVDLTSSYVGGNTWSNAATTDAININAVGLYTIDVTQTDANGCASTSAPINVTVNALPTSPIITASGPTTFCFGNSVDLSSSYVGGNTWSTTATTDIINISAVGVYNIDVTHTDVNGCSATSAPISVTVNALPATPVITASGPSTFCFGNSVDLTSSYVGGNTWSNTATTDAININAVGVYTIDVTQTDANGCASTSAPINVTVNALPIAPIITASGPTTFCFGNSVDLTSSYVGGNAWSTTATTDAININVVGVYNIDVTHTDANGCSATSTPISVTVNALPATPTITANGPTTFCFGNSVDLTSSYAGGNTWSNAATTDAININAVGVYTIDVTQTDANGCSSTSAPITVTVNALPVTPTIAASGPTTFCFGSSVDLTSSYIGGNTWSTTATTDIININAVGVYNIDVTHTDVNGCSATSAPISVVVNALPTQPVITAFGSLVICNGSAVTLASNEAVGNVWSNSATTQSINASAAGNYTVTYTDGNGCSQISDAVQVIINTPIPASFSLANSVSCEGGPSVVLGGGTPAGGNYIGAGIINNILYPALLPGGVYNIDYVVNDANGCTAIASQNYTINAAPVVSASATQSILCLNESPTLLTGSPLGGVFTGNGIVGSNFDPSIAGAGIHTIAYQYTDINSCSSISSFDIIVNPLPQLTLLPVANLCALSGTYNLNNGFPAGGSYLIDGIVETEINTNTLSVGSHTLTYNYSPANSCGNSISTQFTINAPPIVSLPVFSDLCATAAPVVLSGGLPAGGNYTGSGVLGGVFYPNLANPVNSIIYSYTDGNGCNALASQTITVLAPQAINFAPISPVCLNSAPFTINTASPSGGNYSGIGVVSNTFDPAIAGVGVHNILYEITDVNGCLASATQSITVNALPALSTVAIPTICSNNSAVTLTFAQPVGGIYSGTGVNNGMFDPSIAGNGAFNLLYIYTDNNTCTDTISENVIVNAAPAVTHTNYAATCGNAGLIALTNGLPIGGTYTGNFVSNDLFNSDLSGAGTFAINYSYTDVNGCSGSASADIVVNPLPIASLSPLGNICSGAGNIILSNGLPTGGTYYGLGVNNGILDPTLLPNGTQTLGYTFTDVNGCIDSTTITYNTYTLQANAGIDQSVTCTTSALLQGQSNYSGIGALSYSWSPALGLSSTNTQTTIATPSSSTNYILTVSDGVCSSNDTVLVVVQQSNFNLAVTPSAQILNSAPFIVFFTNNTPSPSNFSFVWDFGDGTTYNGFQPIYHNYTSNGSFTVSLIATALGSGCIDTLVMSNLITCNNGIFCNDSANIFINGVLIPNNSTYSTSVCANQNFLLSSNTGANYSYQWYYNGVPLQGGLTSTYSPSVTGYYAVSVEDSGCINLSSPVYINVLPTPAIPYISSSGSNNFCGGGSLTLSANTGYNSYLWSTGSTQSSITINTSGNYWVQGFDANGCSAQSLDFAVNGSNMLPQYICVATVDTLLNENKIIWEKPITTSIDSFVVYRESTLAGVYNEIGRVAYEDNSEFVDTASNPETNNNRYRLAIKDSCGNLTTQGDIHGTIKAIITPLGNGDSLEVTFTKYIGIDSLTYTLYRGPSINALSPIGSNYTFNTNTNLYSIPDLAPPAYPSGYVYYQVRANLVNLCNSDSNQYQQSVSNTVGYGNALGITQTSQLFEVNAFPNPNNGSFNISIETGVVEDISLIIYDQVGAIVWKKQLEKLNGKTNVFVPLEQAAQGVYQLQVTSNKKVINKRLIINK